MAPKSKRYYYCIVPLCKSTSIKTPDKEFITIPRENSRREQWIKAMGRNLNDISQKSSLFVCEDHFNLEEDLDNYYQIKFMGARKRLKSHVVPHKFSCQQKCCNDSESSDKHFFSVPKAANIRPVWCLIAGRGYVKNNSLFCCEDHFNVCNGKLPLQLMLQPSVTNLIYNCKFFQTTPLKV